MSDFVGVVVDNSQKRLADGLALDKAVVLHAEQNLGYGEAINVAAKAYPAEYIAALNDDAEPSPEWLAESLALFERHGQCGMAAAAIRFPDGKLDSAGLGIARDGSSKQRRPAEPLQEVEVFCPSGAAAVYLQKAFVACGGFDADFFLYCEDTDLGLRLQRLGYECWVAPKANVLHHYSLSSGAASPLKAYYVERNRLRLVMKGFPLQSMAQILPATAVRYLLHLQAMLQGTGAAGAYRGGGNSALGLVLGTVRAHLAAVVALPELWQQRRKLLRQSKLSADELTARLVRFRIPLGEVARQ